MRGAGSPPCVYDYTVLLLQCPIQAYCPRWFPPPFAPPPNAPPLKRPTSALAFELTISQGLAPLWEAPAAAAVTRAMLDCNLQPNASGLQHHAPHLACNPMQCAMQPATLRNPACSPT